MRNMQNTHISEKLRQLHGAVMDIVAVINRPQGDEMLIRESGIRLDRALFPLLVGIERLGPIGVVELAERAGRDYTTVSRQVSKLESLGLISRQENAKDRRIREAVLTSEGRDMTVRIEQARQKIGRQIFEKWDISDLDQLAELMRRYADAVQETIKQEGIKKEPPEGDS